MLYAIVQTPSRNMLLILLEGTVLKLDLFQLILLMVNLVGHSVTLMKSLVLIVLQKKNSLMLVEMQQL